MAKDEQKTTTSARLPVGTSARTPVSASALLGDRGDRETGGKLSIDERRVAVIRPAKTKQVGAGIGVSWNLFSSQSNHSMARLSQDLGSEQTHARRE